MEHETEWIVGVGSFSNRFDNIIGIYLLLDSI